MMQKKIIALAVAGLASTAAFAQTNVQIYGLIDYGYAYRFDNFSKAQNGSSINDLSAFNGGQASGSRIGFKGTEDLGNGLKAVFLVEQGLAIDASNTSGSQSINFTRQAYAGLTGNFGTLIGGRLYTPHYTLWQNVIDPFAAGTVGRFQNVMGGNLAGEVTRVDNAVAYVSPSFGGFTVTAAYSNKLEGQEQVGNNGQTNGNDTNVYAILGRYTAGNLDIGLNYHYAKFQGSTAAADPNDTYNITLGGNYDFKFLKLSGAIAYNETTFIGSNVSDGEVWNYFLGLTVPVGKVDIKASAFYSDADSNGTAQQYAIGANYNFSKRTDLYAAYSYIDTDNARQANVFRTSGVGDSGNAGLNYGQGIQLGLRHRF